MAKKPKQRETDENGRFSDWNFFGAEANVIHQDSDQELVPDKKKKEDDETIEE
jgi:hypothetical protein